MMGIIGIELEERRGEEKREKGKMGLRCNKYRIGF